MDPVSVAGVALGVASLSLQVYTGCIQGIQLLVTALGYDDECRYLNLRLRLEQQRLFAWSEASGLLDLDAANHERVLGSNAFGLHRQTVLDLLVQVRCLFDDFTAQQRRHDRLRPVHDAADDVLAAPERDARDANFPMSPRKRDFIKKAMAGLRRGPRDGWTRLRWAALDRAAFEALLARFAALNDAMTGLLDHSLQLEVRHTVQDTNRGVLLLHRKLADLSHLVLALKSQLDAAPALAAPPARLETARALQQLAALAKFKAFNEAIDPQAGAPSALDAAAAAAFLGLAAAAPLRAVELPRRRVELGPAAAAAAEAPRCEALLAPADGIGPKRRVWVEWKDYDAAGLHPDSLSKPDIVDRVRKLAALLNHGSKPDAFRTPHCLGFFDKADPDLPDDDVDVLDRRLGLVFERPADDGLHATLPPVSLHELLREAEAGARLGSAPVPGPGPALPPRKPRVTERVQLALALSNCLLYLHAVNWLHKGLRSHNVLFFRSAAGAVDLGRPVLAGFDFSRPGGPDEMTDAPTGNDTAEHDLYRHPLTQSSRGRRDRARSSKSFDVYSLGVMLVELAHWRPVDAVLAIDMRRARGNAQVAAQVRHRLLAEPTIADVGAAMGLRFEQATRTCLAGGAELGLRPGDDETADDVAERLSARYYQDVVKKLGEIVV